MSLYSFNIDNISRASGKRSSSAVAAAAYRNRATMTDDRTGMTHDYTARAGLYHARVYAPSHTPRELFHSPTLWNQVEKTETRSNSRLAKDFKIALQTELSPEQNKLLIEDFVKNSLVKKGMVVDCCIHDIESNNPHVHLMTSTRQITPTGFAGKVREWDKVEFLEELRKDWQDKVNHHFKINGIEKKVSCESLENQKLEALHNAELAMDEKSKIEFFAEAVKLDRPAQQRISLKEWNTEEAQKNRIGEQNMRNEKINEAENLVNDFADLQNEIIIQQQENLELEKENTRQEEIKKQRHLELEKEKREFEEEMKNKEKLLNKLQHQRFLSGKPMSPDEKELREEVKTYYDNKQVKKKKNAFEGNTENLYGSSVNAMSHLMAEHKLEMEKEKNNKVKNEPSVKKKEPEPEHKNKASCLLKKAMGFLKKPFDMYKQQKQDRLDKEEKERLKKENQLQKKKDRANARIDKFNASVDAINKRNQDNLMKRTAELVDRHKPDPNYKPEPSMNNERKRKGPGMRR